MCEYKEPKAAQAKAQKLLNESDSDFENEVLGSTHLKGSSAFDTKIRSSANTETEDDGGAIKSTHSGWACGTCTLINETNPDFCEACGVEKCDI